MPRPRVYGPAQVLDAVEALAARSGPAAVTIRAVGEATGASNGAVYHGFGSRAGLIAAAWLRAAQRFLAVQRELVDAAPGAAEAVVAAADAAVVFADRDPDACRLLFALRLDELSEDGLPAQLSEQLRVAEESSPPCSNSWPRRCGSVATPRQSTPSPPVWSTCPPLSCSPGTGWATPAPAPTCRRRSAPCCRSGHLRERIHHCEPHL